MKKLIEALKTVWHKYHISKSVCDRCSGTGDMILFNMLKDECPRCNGSGKQTVC